MSDVEDSVSITLSPEEQTLRWFETWLREGKNRCAKITIIIPQGDVAVGLEQDDAQVARGLASEIGGAMREALRGTE